MKIRYIGPHDEVELPDGTTVKRNHMVDVADDLAGHAPSRRLVPAMRELHEAIAAHEHFDAKVLREEITGLSDGSGLLAQFDNWEKVTDPAKKAAKKKAGRKPVVAPPVNPEPVTVAAPIDDEVKP